MHVRLSIQRPQTVLLLVEQLVGHRGGLLRRRSLNQKRHFGIVSRTVMGNHGVGMCVTATNWQNVRIEGHVAKHLTPI